MKKSIDLRDFRHFAFLSTKEETTAKLLVDKANQECPESKTIAVMTLGGTYHLYQRKNEPEMVEAVEEESTEYKTEQTALMKQYKSIKEKHSDALILMRINDFYEAFEEDAITISKILGIILVKRNKTISVTGFPVHSLDTYLPKLVRSGNKVAICEQLESPANLVQEDNSDEYMTSEWETIATSRMKEINRLRALISAGKGHNATFIEEVGTEQTGGGVMVDFVNFKTLPYVIGITDDSVVVYKNRASFCGDEADVIGSIALEEPKAGYQTLDYIDKVIADMEKLRHAFYRLSATWARDDKFGIDLNEYMHEKYPFQYSLDDLAFKVKEWEEDSASKLIRLRKSLEPNLADRNNLGEPSAPYFTKDEAKGKWIMAFDTICQGWACVTDHEGKPALYNSELEVLSDDMFNPEEDLPILATEFLEGRKLIFGGKGARTEGVSIVKEKKAEYIASAPRILIHMEGGVIQWIGADRHVNVLVVDVDAIDDGEKAVRGINIPDFICGAGEFYTLYMEDSPADIETREDIKRLKF